MKTQKAINKTRVESSVVPPLKILFILILLSYIIVTVITPSLGAADRNGPKFLFVSLINLFSFLVILTQREFRDGSNVSTPATPSHPSKFLSINCGRRFLS
jgi:uncharacterized sodium:solute symporter family permease YidK